MMNALPMLFDDLPLIPCPAGGNGHNASLLYRIIMHGIPVPKGRPRARIAGYGKKQFVQFYQPKETEDYERRFAMAARTAIGNKAPIDAPVALSILIALPIPESFSNKKAAAALRGEELPAVRPDIDNYVKAALDSMNGIVYVDDGRVTDLHVRKRYSDQPRLEVEVFI